MPHFLPLLLLIPTVLCQYATTSVDLNQIVFETNNPFSNYFPIGTNGNGMKVQCECQASTGTGQAVQQVSKLNPVNNIDRSVVIEDMSFQLTNPADSITLTCSVRVTITNDVGTPLTAYGVVLFYTAANDDNFAPNSYPMQGQSKRFADQPEWQLTATINKRCSNGNANNFNCDDRCQSTMCNNNANICCPEQVDTYKCTCISNPFTCSPSSSTLSPPDKSNCNTEEFCPNEDLYFWIMIGLACLSGLLLILLIICLSYICCALSSEDTARKEQQQHPQEAVRPPPPVYLSTPPRDPRYGYRGPPPLDPYGRPEAGYREEYVGVAPLAPSSLQSRTSQDADIDSLAGEWTAESTAGTRREARV